MACNCELCQRDQTFTERLARVPEAERGYWEGIYTSLLHAEMDRDVNAAVIDGSWPDADDWIKRARKTSVPRETKAKRSTRAKRAKVSR